MAEPKKETVRIALPPRPEQTSHAPSTANRDTVRIVLPTRTPITPIRREPPKIMPAPASEETPETPTVLPRRPPTISPTDSSPLLQPLPKPPGIENENGPVAPAAVEISPVDRGPKKETARISVLPRPTPAAPPAINMTKTQPLLVHPPTGVTPPPAIITSKPLAPLDSIPRPLCWALLAISAVIFLIQIWNYVVS
ncbi:MAG TPA: hypothetical protein VH252_07510 [Chthoniobacterales bacterium]|jgi:hypothetical protein|nr:hypothetical protein [Chthoniobacterales bacterium]